MLGVDVSLDLSTADDTAVCEYNTMFTDYSQL